MKMFLALALTVSFIGTASAASNAEKKSIKARACHEKVGLAAQAKLVAQAKIASGKQARQIRAEMENLGERLSSFVAAETGCNEQFDGNDRFNCYTQTYARESISIANRYQLASEVSAISECNKIISLR